MLDFLINKKVKNKENIIGTIFSIEETQEGVYIKVKYQEGDIKTYGYPDAFYSEYIIPVDNDLIESLNLSVNDSKENRIKNLESVINFTIDNDSLQTMKEIIDENQEHINKSNDIEEIKIFSEILLLNNKKHFIMQNILYNLKSKNISSFIIDKEIEHKEFGKALIYDCFKIQSELYIKIKYKEKIKIIKFDTQFIKNIFSVDNIVKCVLINLKDINEIDNKKNSLYDKLKNKYNNRETKYVKNFDPNKITDEKVISDEDFVVKTNIIQCKLNGHDYYDITAILAIMTDNRDIIFKKIPAYFCENCGMYYILNEIFEDILQFGIPICKMYDSTINTIIGGYRNMNLAAKSILNVYGYNVGKEDGLTAFRRQNILARIIDTGIMTKNDILSFLSWLKEGREYDYVKFYDAIEKWEEDIDFVASYKQGEYQQIYVRSISNKLFERKRIR